MPKTWLWLANGFGVFPGESFTSFWDQVIKNKYMAITRVVGMPIKHAQPLMLALENEFLKVWCGAGREQLSENLWFEG